MHYAAHNGHLDIIRKLVCDHRCDIIAKDDDGDTPLHLAALGGSLSTLCTLIDEFKCDPSTKKSKGRIILHYVAQNGHVDFVRKLVCQLIYRPVARGVQTGAIASPHWMQGLRGRL